MTALVLGARIGGLVPFQAYPSLRAPAGASVLAVSIGLLVALPEMALMALRFGSSPLYGVEGIVGNGDTTYHFFSYVVDRDQLATIIATLAFVVGLTLMFRYTTIGLRMRRRSCN